MKIIVLNHKMNLYYEELDDYIDKTNKIKNNLIIAPSNIYLTTFLNKSNHLISSQDVCYIEKGNYTGKVSWSQIKSLGINYSIIGHSEKNDDIEEVNDKVNICINNGITPILCFTNNNSDDDILNTLNQIKIPNIDNIIFAYEPTFNIGSENIDISYIKNQIDIIYKYLLNKYHKEPKIIYGGGINEHNINEIYNLDKLDGILIGSKSSNINELENLLLKLNEK